jgi:four helix bundle protein
METENQSVKIKNQNLTKSLKTEVKYRAFCLSIEVIRFLGNIDSRNYIRIITDQLVRSTTSIGANIVEAKASASKKEFLNYFQIALKSANETKYWFAMLKELLPERKERIDDFLKETEEIAKIIGTSVLTMKDKRSL